MIAQNLTIINYHKIETDRDFGLTTRHPSDFNDDLECLLQNGYKTVTFKDLKENKNLPDKPIIITFDDAYLSFYENALNFLLAKSMKAVVYVPVNYIGKTNNWDVQLFNKKYVHMNEQQLLKISNKGIEIGSHALSHRFLNHLNKEELKLELKRSKEVLEKIIYTDVLSVSYPFGRANLKVLEIAKKYYDYGVQLLHSKKYPSSYINLSLKRINIYRTDSREFFLKKLEFDKHPIVKIKSQLIQFGAWATILLQKIKVH